MQELQNLELSELMNMLAKHTKVYTIMLRKETSTDEFIKCELTVTAIQKEIEFRKQSLSDNQNLTTGDLPGIN